MSDTATISFIIRETGTLPTRARRIVWSTSAVRIGFASAPRSGSYTVDSQDMALKY